MDAELCKHSFKVRERPLASLAVYNAGFQRCEGGHCWGPGVRDHYLIHYVSGGHGTYAVGGRTYALGAGDMFLARPGETILYRADTDAPWVYDWVGFHGPEAAGLLAETDFSPETPVLHFEGDDSPRQLLRDIYQSRGGRPFERARMTGKLYVFLSWLLERSRHERRRRQAGEGHVERACAFIANNFASPVTVEDVAGHVGVCRSRLYRAFLEHMKMSPAQYLTQFRMRQACLLLESTDLPVKAVAYSVGFEDPLYFSRRFREVAGCAPSEYVKRRHMENNG